MVDQSSERRTLPVLTNETARVIGAIGVVACTLCCLSIPGIAAVLSAVGLTFLRNDRILLPGTIIFGVIVLVAFARARSRHGRQAPLLLAVAAVVLIVLGLRSSGWYASGTVWAGVAGLLALTVWDTRLQRRCRD